MELLAESKNIENTHIENTHIENTHIENTDDIDRCCICHDELKTHLAELSCGHKMHTNCLLDLYVYDILCPLCRVAYKELNAQQLRDAINQRVIVEDNLDRFLPDHRILRIADNPEFIGERLQNNLNLFAHAEEKFNTFSYYNAKIDVALLNFTNKYIDKLIKNDIINFGIKLITPPLMVVSSFLLNRYLSKKIRSLEYGVNIFTTVFGAIGGGMTALNIYYLNNGKKGNLFLTPSGRLRFIPSENVVVNMPDIPILNEANLADDRNPELIDLQEQRDFAENQHNPDLPPIIDFYRPVNVRQNIHEQNIHEQNINR